MRIRVLITVAILATSILAAVPQTALAQAAPAQAVPMDLAPLSQMTGSVEERNAAIEKLLAGATPARMAQINLNDIEPATALRLLSMQTKTDIAAPDDELKKQGVELANITLNLYGVTPAHVLEAIRWQVGVKSGGVEWMPVNGVLTLVPVAQVPRATETAAQKTEDAALAKQLKKPLTEFSATDVDVKTLLAMLANQHKLNLVVDSKSLEHAGAVLKDKVSVTLPQATVGQALDAATAAIKLKDATASYEIWGGMIRISTRARLDREKPKTDAGAAGMP